MTADEFREIALALPGVEERVHMGHPDFRTNGRIFASLHQGDRTGMVRLTPAEQQTLMAEHPAAFELSSGAWGRQGCTNVVLASVDRAALRGAMLLAWQSATSRPAGRRQRPSDRSRTRRTRG